MRRREREQVAEVARGRLEQLSVELAGIRLHPRPRPELRDEQPEEDEPDFWTREEPPLVGPAGLGVPAPVPAPGRHAHPRRAGPTRLGDRMSGWLDDRLPDALRGRVALTGQHGSVVLALLGAALAVAGWLALRSGAESEVVPPPRLVTSTGVPAPTPSGTSTPAGRTPGGSVVVDVAGKVRRPGIVTLPVGSRVQDAIRRAGGARHGVSLTSVNLARPLVDGEQILVGTAASSGVAPSAVGSTPGAGSLVNLNAAGLSELDTLPGVGPVTAQKILDWRSAHGAFTSVDELLEVDGIGDKTLADIAPHVTL